MRRVARAAALSWDALELRHASASSRRHYAAAAAAATAAVAGAPGAGSAANIHRLTEGLPVIAGQVAGAGRGLFALRDIPAHTVIAVASPITLHPPPGALRRAVCFHCLAGLPADGAAQERGGERFCSTACAAAAEREYLDLLARMGASWTRFTAAAEADGAVFPLLAARLAARAVTGAAAPDALYWLCFPNALVGAPPPPWRALHATLREGLDAAGAAADFCTEEWFVGVLARLHLNAFRVDLPQALPQGRDWAAIAAAMAGGSGTAAYALPSLLNHACDGAALNVDAAWRGGNADMTLAARRDIAAGEELRITYIDSAQPVEDRQRELHYNYGFRCSCDACTEELADGAR